MFKDGMFRVMKIEVLKPNSKGDARVRLWFSNDETPRWPVWGVGPTMEAAFAVAVEKFSKTRTYDPARMAKVITLPEAVYKAEMRRIERARKSGVVPSNIAKRV